MAVLANIRKKPIYLIIIIGLALFAFVISGIFTGNEPSRSTIGSVNGEDISNEKFSRLLEAQNNRTSSIQGVKNVWNNVVREQVFKDAIEKAGIVIGEKDVWDAIISNSTIQNDKRFQDESGLFDENKLKEYIATLKDNRDTPEGASQWAGWVNYESRLKVQLEQTAYNDLVKSSLVAPLKEGERIYKSENSTSDIESVYIPYSSIKNDEITVSDAEITAYMNSHIEEFTEEATTAIEFVSFETNPSTEDVEAVKKKITTLLSDREEWNKVTESKETIKGFVNTENSEDFVRTYSDLPYVDKLYLQKDLPTNLFDTLMTKEVGFVYGPYRDGDYFKLSKITSKDGEDSVKSSHILIAYKEATRAGEKVTRTKEEAEVFANELIKSITENNFSDKAKEYSDGPSADKGGELGFYKQGQLAKQYNDFIFDTNNKVGTIRLVETDFGFHIIKIDEKKNEPGLKLAIVAHKIDPSEETESKIYQTAETFALDLTNNGGNILSLAKERNFTMHTANKIKVLQENISNLGKQRDIVKWTFDKETNIGDVKRFDLENGYAIVVLKTKRAKGLLPLKDAKSKIEPILIKEKKASMIRSKITGTTLEDMAKSVGKSVSSSKGISISNANLKGGRDVNVASALLYVNENDIKIIDGINGVYVIKVIKKTEAFKIKNFNSYSNTITSKLKSRTSKLYEALKEGSVIEDNRALFY